MKYHVYEEAGCNHAAYPTTTLHDSFEASNAIDALRAFLDFDPETEMEVSKVEGSAWIAYPDHVDRQDCEHLLCADPITD